MKRQHTITLNANVIEKCAELPITRSLVLSQAVSAAGKEPELLVYALRHRLSHSFPPSPVKVTYTRDAKLDPVIEKLCELSKLTGEEVVRLALEAYIHKL